MFLTFPTCNFSANCPPTYSNLLRHLLIVFLVYRKRPTVHELLDHPWISLKSNLLPSLTTKSTESINITPKSTPISQRKSFSCITTTTDSPPKSKDFPTTLLRNSVTGSFSDSASVRTYTTVNCLCPQCGTACRHLSHPQVTKTTITIDRGILC